MEFSRVKLALWCVKHIPQQRQLHLRDMNSYEREVLHSARDSYGFIAGWIQFLLPFVLISCFPCNLLVTIQFPRYLAARKMAEPERAFQSPERAGLSAVLVEAASQPTFSLCPVSFFTSLPQVFTPIYFTSYMLISSSQFASLETQSPTSIF